MVFQNFALLPHKTVLENIAFPLQVKGVTTDNSIQKALEMVELVGLKVEKIISQRTIGRSTATCRYC